MNIKVVTWSLLIALLLLIAALPTVMLIAFGMLPGIVAAIIDRTEERSATFCVGGLNFCGVFPYLMKLWMEDNSLGQSMHLLTDVFVLAVMYGGACMGWMLYLSLPPVIASFIQVMSERRLEQLRAAQRKILDEWGDEIITDADLGGGGGPAQPTPQPSNKKRVPAAA
jgi:hypothetical protein